MAIVYSYPTATPETQDLLVGTEMAEQGGEGTPRTRTFTIGSIVDLVTPALNLKANIASPTFTGTATLPITNIVAPEPTGTPFYTNNFTSGFGDFVPSPNNDADWTIVSNEAKSGTIPNNGKSGISLTQSCPTDVTLLQYTYRTSTEQDYDYLFVIIDGMIVKRYSGSISSTTDSIAIQTVGTHTVQFVYSKDSSAMGGSDTVWLDNVSLTSGANALTVNKSAYFKDSVYLNNINSTGFISTKTLYAKILDVRNEDGDRGVVYSGSGITFFGPTQNSSGSLFVTDSTSSQLTVKFPGASEVFKASGTATTAYVQMPSANVSVHIGQFADALPVGYMFNVAGTSLFKSDVTVNANITANSFIKTGGNPTEYLMADGNARVHTITNSTQSADFTLATLNSTYSTATIGYTVQCTNAAVLKAYQKTSTGWISYAITNVI